MAPVENSTGDVGGRPGRCGAETRGIVAPQAKAAVPSVGTATLSTVGCLLSDWIKDHEFRQLAGDFVEVVGVYDLLRPDRSQRS